MVLELSFNIYPFHDHLPLNWFACTGRMKIQLGFLDQKSPACVLPCPDHVITNQGSCHYKSVGNFSPRQSMEIRGHL